MRYPLHCDIGNGIADRRVRQKFVCHGGIWSSGRSDKPEGLTCYGPEAGLAIRSSAKYISEVAETAGAELDDLLRALASPHRRQIVQECWSVECTAGELAERLGLAPASTSEHLKVLRKHGLVDLTANGTFRLYRARRERLRRLTELLDAMFSLEEA
jgi:DNA-binding transcriptional ArsR family regulator